MGEAIEIVKSPWQDLFVDLIRNCKKKIHLASPYITSAAADLVIRNIPPGKLDAKYIASFTLEDFLRGSSDIGALRLFGDNGVSVRNIQKLHAKLFIFDETAIVTSGNLTRNGLNYNIEYGILVRGPMVKNISRDFLDIWQNSDCYMVKPAILDHAEKIISKSPRKRSDIIEDSERKFFEAALRDSHQEDVYTGGIESIEQGLNNWEREVFTCVGEIKSGIFKLSQVYSFEKRLQAKFPRNHHVRDKIRQQLQNLRNIGLIEFVDPGVYRRLWCIDKK